MVGLYRKSNKQSMKKSLLLLMLAMVISIATTRAQIVNIPDVNFKTSLVGNAAINTNMDTEIQVSEATAFTGFLSCSNLGIIDLTGISAFVNLTSLSCSQNLLTSLDLSSNAALTWLSCEHNDLTSLILPPSVTFVECYDNHLTALNVAGCPGLYHLATGINPMITLDISNNPFVTFLNCNEMQLTYLNVANGNNTNFTTFNAYTNPNLTCIQVDSVEYSNANWSGVVDSTANFSGYCSPAVINDYSSILEVVAYPNPSHDYLNISTEVELNTTFIILDISGRIISNGIINGNNSILNIEELNTGIYFLQIGDQDRTNIRFIKN